VYSDDSVLCLVTKTLLLQDLKFTVACVNHFNFLRHVILIQVKKRFYDDTKRFNITLS
jgi:hypothetical protein